MATVTGMVQGTAPSSTKMTETTEASAAAVVPGGAVITEQEQARGDDKGRG
jgi:hypothetical protein